MIIGSWKIFAKLGAKSEMSSQCANVGNPLETVAEGEVRSCSLAVRYERQSGRRKLTLALSEWLNLELLEGERGREGGKSESEKTNGFRRR